MNLQVSGCFFHSLFTKNMFRGTKISWTRRIHDDEDILNDLEEEENESLAKQVNNPNIVKKYTNTTNKKRKKTSSNQSQNDHEVSQLLGKFEHHVMQHGYRQSNNMILNGNQVIELLRSEKKQIFSCLTKNKNPFENTLLKFDGFTYPIEYNGEFNLLCIIDFLAFFYAPNHSSHVLLSTDNKIVDRIKDTLHHMEKYQRQLHFIHNTTKFCSPTVL